MAVTIAQWVVTALAVYVGIGAVIGTAFAFVGSRRVDPAAREGTLGFRLMIWPGAIALWPWALRRWRSGADRPPAECTAHRRAAARQAEP